MKYGTYLAHIFRETREPVADLCVTSPQKILATSARRANLPNLGRANLPKNTYIRSPKNWPNFLGREVPDPFREIFPGKIRARSGCHLVFASTVCVSCFV